MRQWDVSRLLPGLHAFMEGGDDKRRRYALRALTWMQDPETIPALVEALSDPFVAEVAADGLAGLAPAHCTEILQSSSHIPLPAEALQRIVGVVGALSREDVDRFLEEALEHENDDVRQAAAAEMSARVEAHHLENLVQALGDTSPLVSQEAIHGLLALARQSESQRHQVAGGRPHCFHPCGDALRRTGRGGAIGGSRCAGRAGSRPS